MMWLLLICAALLSSQQLAVQAHAEVPRTTVNFDFAWRFQPAVEPRYQQCSFEQNVSYAAPDAHGQLWAGIVSSKEICCNECANHDTCRAWDWNGRWCWLNNNSATAKTQAPGRWSGRLVAPWPAHSASPAQSHPEYDDSDWEVVDAPHDFGRHRMSNCQATGIELNRALSDRADWGDNSTDFVNNCRSTSYYEALSILRFPDNLCVQWMVSETFRATDRMA